MSVKRGVTLAVVLLIAALFSLAVLPRPVVAGRALNSTLDNTYGLIGYWPFEDVQLNDDFSSTTVNTARWAPWANCCGYNHNLTFDGQVMKIAITPGGAGWQSAGVSSNFKLRGDFDIQMDYKNLVRGGATDGGIILYTSTTDDDNYYIRRNTAAQNIDVIICPNNNCYVPNMGSVTATSGSLRLTRVGNTMCGWAANIGGSWTSLGCNASNEWYQDVSFLVQLALNTPTGNNTVEFDNFRINSGQVVADTAGAAYDPNDTFSSASLDLNKWTGGGGYTTNGSEVKQSIPAGSGWQGAGFYSKYWLEGDFDLQVDFNDLVRGSPVDGGAYLSVQTAGSDDTFMLRRQINTQQFESFRNINNVGWTQLAGTFATTATSGKMRLTKVGNNMSSYYWSGSAWTYLNSYANNEFLQPVSLLVAFGATSPPDVKSVDFDNFKINSGTTSLTNGNKGYAMNGANFTAGVVGSAMRVDGNDDYIDVGNFNPTNPQNVTLSAWINTVGPIGTSPYYTGYVLVKGADAYTGSYGLLMTSSGGSVVNGNVCLVTAPAGGATGWTCIPTGIIIPGRWHHIAGVINGQNKYVYLDGQQQATGSFTGTLSPITNNVRMGHQDRASYQFPYTGKIDEPTFWNRALSASEITRLYNLGAAPVNASSAFTPASGSTDFFSVSNMQAIPNMRLAGTNASVVWQGNVNASLQDYDNNIRMGNGFVSINKANLHASIDSPANVSLALGGCGALQVYYASGYYANFSSIKAAGQVCNAGSTPACTNFQCVNNTLTFTVSHFDSYAAEGTNAFLPNVSSFSTGTTNFSNVVDVANVGNMTLATSSAAVRWTGLVNASGKNYDQYVHMGEGFVSLDVAALGQSINTTAVVNISGINCLNFDLYYATGVYYSLQSLKSAGTLVATQQNLGGNCLDATKCTAITCTNGVLTFTAQHFDGFGGDNGTDQNVPEFGTWALMIALGLTIGGFVAIKRRS